MEWCDWVVAIYCFLAGAGIAGFWVARLAAGRARMSEPLIRNHVIAEFMTAWALVIAGAATMRDARAGVTVALVGLGSGLLVYASVQSPPFYPDEPVIRYALWATLVSTIVVFGLRVATL
jgi:hypothetical protein